MFYERIQLLNWQRWTELVSAAITILCLAIPPLLPYAPVALGLAMLVALVNGRLSWAQGVFCAAVLAVLALAWLQINFRIPRPEFTLIGGVAQPAAKLAFMLKGIWALIADAWEDSVRLGRWFWIALGCGAGLWMVAQMRIHMALRLLLLLQGLTATVLLARTVYHPILAEGDAQNDRGWIAVQDWAREKTPVNTTFLVPSQPGGFRIYSERPVVCEWRDGTQLYFDASLADPSSANSWWRRLSDIRKDMSLDQSNRQVMHFKDLDGWSEKELKALAAKYGAGYIVLPNTRKRNLKEVFAAGKWKIYQPADAWPPEAKDGNLWVAQDKALEQAREDIERIRKADVRLVITDAAGKPLENVEFKLHLARHAFGFGCSLPFFLPTELGADGMEVVLPPVTEQELKRFLEVFNYTVIPYSGKWMYIEEEEGHRDYADLDKYVNFCAKNGIEMEFHFISGIWPRWFRLKAPAVQAELYAQHAHDLIARYADRIHIWQVVNDTYLIRMTPDVIREIRRTHPELSLGISDCTKFSRIPRRRRGGRRRPALRRRLRARRRPRVRPLPRHHRGAVSRLGAHAHRLLLHARPRTARPLARRQAHARLVRPLLQAGRASSSQRVSPAGRHACPADAGAAARRRRGPDPLIGAGACPGGRRDYIRPARPAICLPHPRRCSRGQLVARSAR